MVISIFYLCFIKNAGWLYPLCPFNAYDSSTGCYLGLGLHTSKYSLRWATSAGLWTWLDRAGGKHDWQKYCCILLFEMVEEDNSVLICNIVGQESHANWKIFYISERKENVKVEQEVVRTPNRFHTWMDMLPFPPHKLWGYNVPSKIHIVKIWDTCTCQMFKCINFKYNNE